MCLGCRVLRMSSACRKPAPLLEARPSHLARATYGTTRPSSCMAFPQAARCNRRKQASQRHLSGPAPTLRSPSTISPRPSAFNHNLPSPSVHTLTCKSGRAAQRASRGRPCSGIERPPQPSAGSGTRTHARPPCRSRRNHRHHPATRRPRPRGDAPPLTGDLGPAVCNGRKRRRVVRGVRARRERIYQPGAIDSVLRQC